VAQNHIAQTNQFDFRLKLDHVLKNYEHESSPTTHRRTAFWMLTLALGLTLFPGGIDKYRGIREQQRNLFMEVLWRLSLFLRQRRSVRK
jgi:hypothetical protein